MDECSREQKRAILSAIPSSSCMVRRRMLDEALAVIYGSRTAFSLENYFGPGVLKSEARNLNKVASLLEKVFETINLMNVKTITECERNIRANEPESTLIMCRSWDADPPAEDRWLHCLSENHEADGDIYALRPTWKAAIFALPILARSARRVAADLDEMRLERTASDAAAGARWRRQAVVEAIEMLADTWTRHLGVAPTLTYSRENSKSGGHFLRFTEATLRPILPPYYKNRSLESAVRSAIYKKSGAGSASSPRCQRTRCRIQLFPCDPAASRRFTPFRAARRRSRTTKGNGST